MTITNVKLSKEQWLVRITEHAIIWCRGNGQKTLVVLKSIVALAGWEMWGRNNVDRTQWTGSARQQWVGKKLNLAKRFNPGNTWKQHCQYLQRFQKYPNPRHQMATRNVPVMLICSTKAKSLMWRHLILARDLLAFRLVQSNLWFSETNQCRRCWDLLRLLTKSNQDYRFSGGLCHKWMFRYGRGRGSSML